MLHRRGDGVDGAREILPLTASETVPLPAALAALADEAADLARGSRSRATWRAYEGDWRDFTVWCADHRLTALPADPVTVGLYLAARAKTLSIATLTRRVSAVAVRHRIEGYHLDTRHPAIRDVMAGLRRSKGVAPRRAEALTVPLAKRVLTVCGDGLSGLRNRALILVGLAGGFRRSELVGLDVTDLVFSEEGLRVRLRRSKGDQNGEGQVVGISRTGSATCPVAACEAWLAAATISEGRVFRGVDRHGRISASLSDRAVVLILKNQAQRAGLDPSGFSGHSLRAGFATSAARAGIADQDIMNVTRHKSSSILRRYIREGDLFTLNIATALGL